MDRGQMFDQLVEDFGLEAKTSFARGEDGVWQIPARGSDILVCLGYRAASDQVIAFARVEELRPGGYDEPRARALLEANAFWRGTSGFTLALDRETDQLVALDRRSPAYFTSVEVLACYVNSLVQLVEELRDELRHLQDAAEIEEELASEGEPS